MSLFRQVIFILAILVQFSAQVMADVTVNLSGQFDGVVAHGGSLNFQSGEGDNNYYRMRLRPRAELASPKHQLKTVVEMQIGEINLGDKLDHGNMGNDEIDFNARSVYLDFTFPTYPARLNFGILDFSLPSATFGNPVLHTRVAGLNTFLPIFESMELGIFYLRPYHDTTVSSCKNNEMDIYGLTLSYTGEFITFIPWYSHVYIGHQSGFWPPGSPNHTANDITRINLAGLAATYRPRDKLTVKFDGMFGTMHNQVRDYKPDAIETEGYMLVGALDYRFGFGIGSFFGWYASGDEKKDAARYVYGNMPTFMTDGFAPTMLGFSGSSTLGKDGIVSSTGTGTWGIGIALSEIQVVTALYAGIRLAYYAGTNEKGATPSGFGNTDIVVKTKVYLTEEDSAVEANLWLNYRIYEELTAISEIGYIKLNKNVPADSAVNVLFGLQYVF